MRSSSATCVLFSVLLAWPTHAGDDGLPLLRYGVSETGETRTWTAFDSAGHTVDLEVRWRGLPSLRLQRLNATGRIGTFGCRWRAAPVRVEPGGVCTAVAMVRTRLEQGAVGFHVCFYRDREPAACGEFTRQARFVELVEAWSDWQFIAFTFQVPADAAWATLFCRGREFLGEAWFNHICLLRGETLPVPLVETVPHVDGRIDEGAWANALTCDQFLPRELVPDDAPHRGTNCRLLFDDTALFLAADCPEPELVRDRRATLTSESGITVWLSPSVDYQAPTWRVDLNADGSSAVHPPGTTTATTVQARVSRGADRFVLEARLPLSLMPGLTPTSRRATRPCMKLALERRRVIDGSVEVSSWSRPSLRVRQPWVWTVVRPVYDAPALPVRFDRWYREPARGGALRGVKNYAVMATLPQFESLLSAEPRRHPGHTGFIWRFAFSPAAAALARRLGIEQDSVELMRDCAAAGLDVYEYWLGTLDDSQYPTKPAVQESLAQSEARVCYYAAYHPNTLDTGIESVPACPSGPLRGRQLVFDPAIEAWSLAHLERTIRANRSRLRSVMIGDEVFVMQAAMWPAFLAAWHRGQLEYPWLDQAMTELKNRYGYGRYGPPVPGQTREAKVLSDIAFRRWFADQTVGVCRRFHETVQRLAPELRVIGPDISFSRYARHYAYSRYEPVMHVLSGQLTNWHMKIVNDLVGDVDLWPCTHRERWGTANEFIAYASENILNGADGFNIWPRGHVSFGSLRVAGQSMFFSHRPRWDAQLYVARQLRDLPRLKAPVPDAAVLFCNTTPGRHEADAALYELLGPNTGAWFQYISDYQIEDARAALGRFAVLFVPQAEYELPCVPPALATYVEAGGTLVLMDPFACSVLADGSQCAFRSDLAGVTQTGEERPLRACRDLSFTDAGLRWLGLPSVPGMPLDSVPASAQAVSVARAPDVEVLAVFADDSPAVIRRAHGKGWCFYFAFRPCSAHFAGRRDWVLLFRAFCRALGLRTGRDAWHFQLPLLPDEAREPRPGRCLTGNHVLFRQGQVTELDLNTDPARVRYRYSAAPEHTPDRPPVADGWIPASRGKLTDRTACLVPRTTSTRKDEDWVVAFKPGPRRTLTVDLGGRCEVRRLVLFHSGTLPACEIHGSLEGQDWQALARETAGRSTQFTHRRALDIAAAPARYLRLQFGEHADVFVLSELEVWGNAAPGTPPRRFHVPAIVSEPNSLPPNGGFEQSLALNHYKRYHLLEKHKWTLGGNAYPRDWEYVTGGAGTHVELTRDTPHRGTYALRLRPSTKPCAFGTRFLTVEAPIGGEGSLWAKGTGELCMQLRCWFRKGGMTTKRVAFEPDGQHQIQLTPEWRQYRGRFTLENPDIERVVLCLVPARRPGQDLWLDDIEFRLTW